jgi:NitT/TauT family transport system permease protein
VIAGPAINLSPLALPWYALQSVGRMLAAYVLSLLFTLAYGYAAARNRTAERVMMPLLDVLQSVPILSFLPVVLLSLSSILPQRLAAELAAVILIFTSQAWNMTYSFYQSMTTIPMELREAAAIFRLDPWQRLKTLELPFAGVGLIWNSMMSWSGGWFFLMAAEIFHVGTRDFRLPGLGSYLQTAASAGDLRAVLLGILTLIVVVVLLDQFVWRPVLAAADRFKLEMTEGDEPPTSWFYQILVRSSLVGWLSKYVLSSLSEQVDGWMRRRLAARDVTLVGTADSGRPSPVVIFMGIVMGAVFAYGAYRAAGLLASLPAEDARRLALGILATFARVATSLVIALAWTIPVGVLIGTNRRVAALLQPVVQVVAAVPATALFPVFLLALVNLPGGLNIAAVVLMLSGTQWYLLFNVIAGASAIPQDLRYTSDLLQLSTWDRWRTLILPSLFPYLITGAITASGGAWNASIVAEHAEFAGQTHATVGVGALIAEATASGNYALLLAGTLALVVTVILINRLFWLRLYRTAEERYRME